jgi:hypothetical protein
MTFDTCGKFLLGLCGKENNWYFILFIYFVKTWTGNKTERLIRYLAKTQIFNF